MPCTFVVWALLAASLTIAIVKINKKAKNPPMLKCCNESEVLPANVKHKRIEAFLHME